MKTVTGQCVTARTWYARHFGIPVVQALTAGQIPGVTAMMNGANDTQRPIFGNRGTEYALHSDFFGGGGPRGITGRR